MKINKSKVFRVLSLILGFAMMVSVVNVNTADAKTKTKKKKNVLVLYFSATGTTKGAANKIKNATGGKIIAIKAADPYTEADLDYSDDESRVTKEHESAASPAKSSVRPKISNLQSIKAAVKKKQTLCISDSDLVAYGTDDSGDFS